MEGLGLGRDLGSTGGRDAVDGKREKRGRRPGAVGPGVHSRMRHSSPNTVCSFRVAGPCNLFANPGYCGTLRTRPVGRLVNLLSSTSISFRQSWYFRKFMNLRTVVAEYSGETSRSAILSAKRVYVRVRSVILENARFCDSSFLFLPLSSSFFG